MSTSRVLFLVPVMLVACSAVAGCVAEPADTAPVDPATEMAAAGFDPTLAADAHHHVADVAPARLGPAGKQKLVSEAQAAFAFPALQVNEDEVLEVTIDEPRIVDRAALGTRYMSWGDPETSAVTEGYTRYWPNASAPSPYVRLRIDASFGDLYLVDCRLTDGTYNITVQDVSGMGGATQDMQVDTSAGHLSFAFDPGPGGYKQLYISKSTGKTSYWALWGCEVTPLQ